VDLNNVPLAAAISAFGVIAANPIATLVNTFIANRNAKLAREAHDRTEAATIAAHKESTAAAAEIAMKVEDARIALVATTSKTNIALAGIEETQSEIHILVNSRLTEALAYIAKLERILQELTGRVPTGEPSLAEAQARRKTEVKPSVPGK